MRFKSNDLGRWQLCVDTILRDDFETKDIIVLGDCEENGFIRIYYGPSLPEALEAINNRLEGYEEQKEVVDSVVQFFQAYEPHFTLSQL